MDYFNSNLPSPYHGKIKVVDTQISMLRVGESTEFHINEKGTISPRVSMLNKQGDAKYRIKVDRANFKLIVTREQ